MTFTTKQEAGQRRIELEQEMTRIATIMNNRKAEKTLAPHEESNLLYKLDEIRAEIKEVDKKHQTLPAAQEITTIHKIKA
jgi:hypothetical protein